MKNKSAAEWAAAAAEVLPRYVHAPFSDVNIIPGTDFGSSSWYGAWLVDDECHGTIAFDMVTGWIVSIDIAANVCAFLAPMNKTEYASIGMPTKARVAQDA